MVIDTKNVTAWVQKHSRISAPVATAVLSWWAALRWEAAFEHNQFPLEVFYFGIASISGVVSAILAIQHLNRLGLFKED